MSSDFYLTLPSNASMELHPDNTLTHYVTALPQRVSLVGQWECGLVEIQYPHSWYNVREEDNRFYLNELEHTGLYKSAKIEHGYYYSPVILIYNINKALARLSKDGMKAKFSYSDISQRVTLYMTLLTVFNIPFQNAMQTILGFHSSIVTSPKAADTREYTNTKLGGKDIGLKPPGTVYDASNNDEYTFRKEADSVVDMAQGFYSLYVYTDVVESRVVGNSFVPLLRIVPIEGNHGNVVSKSFDNVQYIPVLHKEFTTIEIDIRDDTGRRVPFERGRMTAALHFRRRKPSFFET